MKYTSAKYQLVQHKHDADLGIDIPTGLGYKEGITMQPHENRILDTGITVQLPVFGRVRRFLTRLLLGVEVTGIGGLLKPRGNYQ